MILLTQCHCHQGPLVLATYDPTGMLRRFRCVQFFSFKYLLVQYNTCTATIASVSSTTCSSSHRNEMPNSSVARDSAAAGAVCLRTDSHIQRIVLTTEETTMTQQVSHRPIKCQSHLWSQRGTKVNGSRHGDNPLLGPTGIQIATKRYAALQAMAPTNIKTVHQTSLLHILFFIFSPNEQRAGGGGGALPDFFFFFFSLFSRPRAGLATV